MTTPPAIAGLAAPPDPAPDQAARPVPVGIAEMLRLVRILAAYGRLLAAIIPHRTLWPSFLTVARFLGVASLSDTLTRLHRGIMRAIALERLLLQRGTRGHDLRVRARPPLSTDLTAATDSPWQPALDAGPEAGAPDAPPPGPHYPTHRFSDQTPLWIDHLPFMAEVEQEVRRRPLGRTLAAICLDLGIVPRLCASPFWHRLAEAMEAFGGSVMIMGELYRRETRFEREDWKYPRGLPAPARTHEAVWAVLGFVIGEEPVDPFRPAVSPYPLTATGTGPP